MPKVAEKQSPLSRLAPIAKSASTVEDFDKLTHEIETELNNSTVALAGLEHSRDALLFEGGDVEQFHDRLLKERETQITLRSWLTEAQRRRDECKQVAYIADLEAQSRDVHETDVPAAAQALVEFVSALKTAAEAGQRYRQHSVSIEAHDDNVKRHDRPDLVADHRALRARVVAELAGPDGDEGKPVRFGNGDDPNIQEGRRLLHSSTKPEQDSYARWRAKNPSVMFEAHETDEAFNLRLQNWASRRDAQMKAEDPIKVAADEVVKVIREVTDDRDAFERARNGLEVQIQTYVDANGKAVRKLRETSGRGKPNIDPTIEQRRVEFNARWNAG